MSAAQAAHRRPGLLSTERLHQDPGQGINQQFTSNYLF